MLCALSAPQAQESLRKMVIEMVLATDMKQVGYQRVNIIVSQAPTRG